MKLTGKAKIEFDKWLDKQLFGIVHDNGDRQPDIVALDKLFYSLPKSMRWGVYQDWAVSLGYNISSGMFGDSGLFDYEIDFVPSDEVRDTLQEAREAAVEKLNELINARPKNHS